MCPTRPPFNGPLNCNGYTLKEEAVPNPYKPIVSRKPNLPPIRQSDGELRTVAQMWMLYREYVLPKGCPPIQVSECRRAFYAGVQSVLLDGLLGVGDDSIGEEQAMRHLEALFLECEQFAKDVEAGKV
jgi:hypothetical protein